MARMPGAIWKPLAADWDRQPRMKAYDFFCLHTMVGSLVGTDGYFKVGNGTGYGGTESHFGVGPDGTIFQWQDTDFQADANGNGNWHVISSENADTGLPFPKWGGSDVPAMTPEQVEANAQIAAFLYLAHGIPLDIAGSSKPGARGLAVHRYGVPGYAPKGAELWSSATGKACPGDRRIAQAPLVSARSKQIVAELAALGAKPDSASSKEPDMSFIRLGPGENATIPRPRGGQVFVDMAMDNNGVQLTKSDVEGMRVRAAVRRGGNDSQTWLPYNGNTMDFWAPNAKVHSRELAPEDSLLVIANLSDRLALGVTITHVV